MKRLYGKVALISGAARGMGQAEARLFAEEGARVLLCDIHGEETQGLAREIGDAALPQHLDVTQEDQWAEAVQRAMDEFGRLDVLINNAGIAEAAPLMEMTLESYRRVTEVNQTGVFLGMRCVAAATSNAPRGAPALRQWVCQ